MWKIHGIRQLDALDNEAFASILLCYEVDAGLINSFSESFNSLNERFGHTWHLCLPGYDPLSNVERVYSENYNYVTAAAYIRHSNLPRNSAPCIAFAFGPKTEDQEYYTAQYTIGYSLRTIASSQNPRLLDDFLSLVSEDFEQYSDHGNYSQKAKCIFNAINRFHKHCELDEPVIFGTGLQLI